MVRQINAKQEVNKLDKMDDVDIKKNSVMVDIHTYMYNGLLLYLTDTNANLFVSAKDFSIGHKGNGCLDMG
jgi:hypothetical protein